MKDCFGGIFNSYSIYFFKIFLQKKPSLSVKAQLTHPLRKETFYSISESQCPSLCMNVCCELGMAIKLSTVYWAGKTTRNIVMVMRL